MIQGIREKLAGFTLLEVLVSVAILALALTAIFASEVGSIKVAHRARMTTTASLLARCKMGEIEEHIAREGVPAIEEVGTDDCCEGAEVEGFECDWSITRVELPEPGLEGDALGEGEEGEGLAEAEAPSSPEEAAELAEGTSLEGILGGSSQAPGGDMMAELAMSYVYPILQPTVEEQVRRAEVEVRWNEGSRVVTFPVVQYVVAPPPEEGGNL